MADDAHQESDRAGSLIAAYWSESVRPLASLALVGPMLLLYEGGLLILGPEAARNGVDVWLRQFLQFLGFTQYLLLPLLTSAILLAWQHLSNRPWRVDWRILLAMLIESAVLGFVLLNIANVLGNAFAHYAPDKLAVSWRDTGQRVLGPFGAGIYEELLFRLMLLPIVYGIARAAKQSRVVSGGIAIIGTSLLFSAAHFQMFTGYGDPFQWYSFTFRFVAGAVFALLFVYRGFGIAVGSHAFYDVFVTVSMMTREG